MIKVIGYARKSPDDKESTEVSIINQESLIKDTCKKKGWSLEKIFTDKNITGSDRFRTGFVEMINYSIKNNTNIIVKDQSRFCRDSAFFKDTLKDLDVRGIKVFSIIKNDFLDYEDLGDNVRSLLNEDLIITNRKKSNILFEQKKNSKLPPIRAPYGYKNKNKTWVIIPKDAEKVRQVCLDCQNGIKKKDTLDRLKICESKYHRILKNVKKGLYSGYIIYNKKYTDSKGKEVRTEEVKYLGSHQLIISKELFYKIRGNKNV